MFYVNTAVTLLDSYSLQLAYNKSVFSLVNPAVNATMPTFAAVRCAAATLLVGTSTTDISSAHAALTSKPAAAAIKRWDRQTDT